MTERLSNPKKGPKYPRKLKITKIPHKSKKLTERSLKPKK